MEKKFIKTLEYDYNYDRDTLMSPPKNKLQYLGESVFNFTTYDGEVDEIFSLAMLETIKAILERKTFEYYTSNKANQLKYLLMVNMPFMVDKLDWGSSIRGAWFDDNHTCEIFYGLTIESGELTEFMTQLLEWSEMDKLGSSPMMIEPPSTTPNTSEDS